MKKIVFLFLFLVLVKNVFAQTDSTQTIIDTVFVDVAPVIVKKTVIVEIETPQNKKKWFLSVNGLHTLPIFHSNNQFKFKNGISGLFSIGYKFKKVGLSVGLGYTLLNTNSLNNNTYSFTGKRNITVLDTVDIYYQFVNGIKTPRFVTQTISKTENYTYLKDTLVAKSYKYYYLELPLTLSYFIEKNKMVYSSEFVTNISILTSKHSQSADYNLKSYYLSIQLGGNLSYQLSEKMIIGFSYHLQQNLTSILNYNNLFFSNQRIGLNIRYWL